MNNNRTMLSQLIKQKSIKMAIQMEVQIQQENQINFVPMEVILKILIIS